MCNERSQIQEDIQFKYRRINPRLFEVLIVVVFLGRVEMGREVASEVLIMLFLNVYAIGTRVF